MHPDSVLVRSPCTGRRASGTKVPDAQAINDRRRMIVRKLLLATAIATLVAAPAIAQQGLAPSPVNPYAGPQQQHRAVSGPYAAVGGPSGPYAAEPMLAPSAPVAVSTDGRYLGADPDPFIRLSMIRDQDQILGSGPN
jgi:hypothetical protein